MYLYIYIYIYICICMYIYIGIGICIDRSIYRTGSVFTCEMLMKEPLEPVVTMFLTLLVSLSDFWAEVPAESRALLSTFGVIQKGRR